MRALRPGMRPETEAAARGTEAPHPAGWPPACPTAARPGRAVAAPRRTSAVPGTGPATAPGMNRPADRARLPATPDSHPPAVGRKHPRSAPGMALAPGPGTALADSPGTALAAGPGMTPHAGTGAAGTPAAARSPARTARTPLSPGGLSPGAAKAGRAMRPAGNRSWPDSRGQAARRGPATAPSPAGRTPPAAGTQLP